MKVFFAMHIYRLVAVLLTATYVTAAPIHLNQKGDSHPSGGQVAKVQHHHTHVDHHAQIVSPESIHSETGVDTPTEVEIESAGGPHPAKGTSAAKATHTLERRAVPKAQFGNLIAGLSKALKHHASHKRPSPVNGRPGHLGILNIANRLREAFKKMGHRQKSRGSA